MTSYDIILKIDVIFQKNSEMKDSLIHKNTNILLIKEEVISVFKVIAVHCFRVFVFVFENVPTVWMLVFSEV